NREERCFIGGSPRDRPVPTCRASARRPSRLAKRIAIAVVLPERRRVWTFDSRRTPMSALLLTSLLLSVSPHDRSPATARAQQPRFVPAPGSPIPVGPMAGRPVVADLNGDGHADVVLGCGTCCGSPADPESGKVVVLLGDGRGNLREARDSAVRIGPSSRKV